MVDCPNRIVATNRKAFHHYEILETYEAGMVLSGSEVKSLRAGQASIQEGFARVSGSQVLLYNVHIPPYIHNTRGESYDPIRTRKLLLHQAEIKRLMGRLQGQGKGCTLLPLEIYFKRGWAKLSLALAKGKRGPDRRDQIKKRDTSRELERDFKGRYKL